MCRTSEYRAFGRQQEAEREKAAVDDKLRRLAEAARAVMSERNLSTSLRQKFSRFSEFSLGAGRLHREHQRPPKPRAVDNAAPVDSPGRFAAGLTTGAWTTASFSSTNPL